MEEQEYDIYLPRQFLQGSSTEPIYFGKQKGTSFINACDNFFKKHPDNLYNGKGYYWESELKTR